MVRFTKVGDIEKNFELPVSEVLLKDTEKR